MHRMVKLRLDWAVQAVSGKFLWLSTLISSVSSRVKNCHSLLRGKASDHKHTRCLLQEYVNPYGFFSAKTSFFITLSIHRCRFKEFTTWRPSELFLPWLASPRRHTGSFGVLLTATWKFPATPFFRSFNSRSFFYHFLDFPTRKGMIPVQRQKGFCWFDCSAVLRFCTFTLNSWSSVQSL